VIPIADQPQEPQGPGRGPEDPGDPGEARQPPTEQEVHDELAREILRIHEESYGRGAQRARTLMGKDFVVVILDDLELLPNEKFLIENGKAETVTQVRTQYQHAIRSSFSAAVERATGRTVVGFTSATSIDEPRFMAEIFKLR
jgi:uncharacterized protein YbcI